MSMIILAVLASVVVAAPGSKLAAHPPTSIATLGCAHDPAGAPDTARVSAMLAKGDSLEAAGRVHAARRQYQSLIDQQRVAGQYPLQALWHLVNSYYFHDDELRAASTLDDLAAAAGQFGDPATELRASFEAALLYQRHHQPTRVAQKVVRVRALLHSPVIDEATKKEIEKRLADA
jgi:hypothetical protein